MSFKIIVDNEKCGPFLNEKGCDRCLTGCSLGVFLSSPQPWPLKPGIPIDHYRLFAAQPRLCVRCGKCLESCPAGAIKMEN